FPFDSLKIFSCMFRRFRSALDCERTGEMNRDSIVAYVGKARYPDHERLTPEKVPRPGPPCKAAKIGTCWASYTSPFFDSHFWPRLNHLHDDLVAAAQMD